MIKYSELSKTISHALRHEPWLYELELQEDGWVNIELLITALQNLRDDWTDLNINDLTQMLKQSDKERFNIADGKIRALYGHSLPGKLLKSPAVPPDILYHGTSISIIDEIKKSGLRPMNRQYVHLSVDKGTAEQVGRRKTVSPIILTIFAKKASDSGFKFYQGNDHVWLSDEIFSQFIEFQEKD